MKTKVFIPFLLILLLCEGCTHLIFSPRKKDFFPNPYARYYGPQDVYFKTPDGLTLHGWFLKARDEAAGTILVLHGNAENLSTHVNGVLWLVDEGYNIFIFDYRGYGKSEGTPTIAGVHADAETALETLLAMPDLDQDRVIVLGQSIGGAIAVYMVSHSPHKDRVKALILDSPLADYRLIAREKIAGTIIGWPFQYPLSWLVNGDYSPIKFVKSVAPVPIVIMHGEQDRVVPIHHGRLLYDAASEPKEFWQTPVRGHVRSFADEKIRDKLMLYLDSLLYGQ